MNKKSPLPDHHSSGDPAPATHIDRRTFLASLAVGAGAGAAVPLALRRSREVSAAAAAPVAPFCGSPQKSVLAVSDLTYLGYYNFQTSGFDSAYSQGLTHRYVNGDLRFLSFQLRGQLHEISIAGRNFGDTITTPTNHWDLSGANMSFIGLWWEEAKSRLWTTTATDYTVTVYQTQVFTRTLNADGTVSNVHGPVGLAGINAKRAYGGAQPVPSWFQSQYGVGPYVIGWGGYTSLMRQGGGCSLGPTMYAIPDPAGIASGVDIPTGMFRIIMDCNSGTNGNDWYAAGSPTTLDRGIRLTNPVNYFDGGDPRQNPPSRPTSPPVSGAQWLSPAPDGHGRFTWGDSYYNTGCWIDGPNKQGFLMVASLGGGSCWYQSGTLEFDSRIAEVHIFDPARLGEAALGTRPVWNVKPSSMAQLSLPGLGSPFGGNTQVGNAAGATYDPVSGKLYVMGFGADTNYARLYVFAVSA